MRGPTAWSALVLGVFVGALLGPVVYSQSLEPIPGPVVRATLSWDLGCEYNQFGTPNPQAHGTELWGAWSREGFNAGPTWSNLLSGASTERFRIADIPGQQASVTVLLPAGMLYVTVYAYIDQVQDSTTNVCYDVLGTPVTNVTHYPTFRSRSNPANILALATPAPLMNLNLLSADVLEQPTNLVQTIEIDLTGSNEKYFTAVLVPKPPVPSFQTMSENLGFDSFASNPPFTP